jgi:protein gp37
MASQRDGGVSWTNPSGYWGESWNIALGCADRCGVRCWAERQAIRQSKPGEPYAGLVESTPEGPRWTGAQRFATERLAEPLHWREPRVVATSLMGDLFGSGITVRQIAQAYVVMIATPQHRYCVLTKQAERRRRILSDPNFAALVAECGEELAAEHGWCHANPVGVEPPASNVVELVSCSDQATVDELVPILLRTPAAWRGLSLEPQLGPVTVGALWSARNSLDDAPIDWVVVGPETGPGARYCDPEHQAAVVRQCVEAGVPVHVKAVQLGSASRPRVSRKPEEWPAEMRVRQWPEAFRLGEVPRG